MRVLQVFVFCCAHASQIVSYLQQSKWMAHGGGGGMRVTPIVSTNCQSAGEALRLIDQKDVIKHDFVLLSGDTVANVRLAPILEAHKARREKDKNAIMTMVMKPIGQPKQRLRVGDSELLVVVDPATRRLLKYVEHEAGRGSAASVASVDAALFGERDRVQVRTDLLDTQIAICTPEVLMLFSDNFDYQ